MTTRTRPTAVLVATAGIAAFVLLCGSALAAGTVSPLPASNYSVRSVCATPASGHAGCLALKLVPQTSAARAHARPLGMTRSTATAAGSATKVCEQPTAAEGCYGLRPQDLHSAYQLPTSASGTQTIALVDVYNDLHAEADLEAYDNEFGLPECTTEDGCFEKVNQNGDSEPGNLPFPATQMSLEAEEALCQSGTGEYEEACVEVEEAYGWGVEISLDIETAHATCQSCHIALVEADSSSYTDLGAAEEAAVRLHANEISNSWGGAECEAGPRCIKESPAFNQPGVVITASAGDDGYLNWLGESPAYANFPASSPHVVAVGGTRLDLRNGEWAGESVWNDGGESGGHRDGHGAGGGGCSIEFAAPAWQQSVSDWSAVGCGSRRSVADVSADADPYTGLAVYDSSPECEEQHEEEGVVHTSYWCTIGGTSLASPLIASVYALAGGAQGVEYPARTLYENAASSPSSLHDVIEGSNGACLTPFDEETASPSCTAAEEAETSCPSKLRSCRAGIGYDGPTGVGTPDGIVDFQPSAEALAGIGGGGKGPPSTGSGGSGSGSTGTGSSPAPAPVVVPTTVTPTIDLSGLALTIKAVIALNTSRPKVADVSFTFLSNANVRVLATLQKRVGKGRHSHWQTLTHPLAIAAVVGRNSRHLSGHAALGSGSYRLVLTPVHATAHSVEFKIG
jgi:Subtilase family